MDTKLIVVRHAQGFGNKDREFHGHYPSDLTEFGKKQAECTADFLENTKIDVAFASDTPRAFSTARIIAQRHGIDVVTHVGLREIYAGLWEKMLFCDIEKNYPCEFEVWSKDLGNAVCPEGESVMQLKERVQKTIEEIVKQNPGKTILIGTHATPIRVMSTVWNNVELCGVANGAWVPNASVSIINYDSKTLHSSIEEFAIYEHLEKANLLTENSKNL